MQPFIVHYDAGSVPVGQLVFSNPLRSPGEMQDIALNRVRPRESARKHSSSTPRKNIVNLIEICQIRLNTH